MSLTRRVHRLKIQEIRAFSLEELNKQLNDSYRELFNLRFRLATRQLVNYHEIRNVRKRIARIKTIMKEIELSIEE
ncbi:MAG: 50S ribosomal protein L29 [Dehalococcoidia bacterium]|nr:50S ribosomal protein L29 [Dehalococcoidia bacterium]